MINFDFMMNDENKTYTITLSNGIKIDDLKVNGDNFISKDEIDPTIFSGGLSKVTVSDGETEKTYTNLALIQVMEYEGEWLFAFREVPRAEIEMARVRSDLDYLAMMANIDI